MEIIKAYTQQMYIYAHKQWYYILIERDSFCGMLLAQ